MKYGLMHARNSRRSVLYNTPTHQSDPCRANRSSVVSSLNMRSWSSAVAGRPLSTDDNKDALPAAAGPVTKMTCRVCEQIHLSVEEPVFIARGNSSLGVPVEACYPPQQGRRQADLSSCWIATAAELSPMNPARCRSDLQHGTLYRPP